MQIPDILLTIIRYFNKIPTSVLVLIPTLIFGFILLFCFIRGLLRGFGKSLKLLIVFLLAAGLSFGCYYILFKDASFDTNILKYTNQVLGIFHLNSLNSYLNVSEDVKSLTQLVANYLLDSPIVSDEQTKLAFEELVTQGGVPYFLAILEMSLRLIFFFIFLVLFWVIKLVFYIIYLIFFREGRKKKKQNRAYRRGYRAVPYQKKAFLGGLLGLCKGLVTSIIVFSFFGSIAYVVSGGSYNDQAVENETQEEQTEEMQAITTLYNFFKTYGTTGIGAVLEGFKNSDNVPYYLMISDFISKGYLEDPNVEISEYVLLREELAIVTAISDEALAYIIRNNYPIIDGDFEGLLQLMINDPEFEATIDRIIDKAANEKIFTSLAKSMIDSMLTAFADTQDNKYINLFFGTKDGNVPISVSKGVLNKNNFKIVCKALIRLYNLYKTIGDEDTITYICNHPESVDGIVSLFKDAKLFDDPSLRQQLNQKLRLAVNIDIANMVPEINIGFFNEIEFFDTYDTNGNKVKEGEITKILSMTSEILSSGIISKMNDTPALFECLFVVKDGADTNLVSKLLESDIIYYAIASVLDSSLVQTADFSLYVPEDCKVNGYISREEIQVLVNCVSQYALEIDFSNIQIDAFLKDTTKLKNVLDSKILQANVAVILSSRLNIEQLTIPAHLDIYQKLASGDYELDEFGNKIIDEEKMSLWLDDNSGSTMVPGEVRRLVSSVIDLGILENLFGEEGFNFDIKLILDLKEEQVLPVFSSDLIRYSATNLVENVDLGGYEIVIPYVSMSASNGTDELAIKATEFWQLMQALIDILDYDKESEEDFDITNIEFNFNTILDKSDQILKSTILNASAINLLVNMQETVSFLAIDEEYKKQVISTDGKPSMLVTNYNSVYFVREKEIVKIINAVKLLDIVNENGEFIVPSLSVIKTLNTPASTDSNETKLDVILRSEIIWSSLSNLLISAEDGELSIPIVVTADTLISNKIKKKEFRNLIDGMEHFIDENGEFIMDLNILSDEELINDLLKSRILEATVAKEVVVSLTPIELITLPSSYYENDDLSYLNNWISSRNSELEIINNENGEIRRMIDAANALGVISEIVNGSFDLNISELLTKSQDEINIITNSRVINYTMSSLMNDQQQIVIPEDIRENVEDGLFTLSSDEIYSIFQILNVVLDGTSFEEMNFGIDTVVSQKVRDLINDSIIFEATVVNVLLENSTDSGQLADIMAIPDEYAVTVENNGTLKSALERQFMASLWNTTGEVTSILKGVNAFGFDFNAESNSFSPSILISLEEKYQETPDSPYEDDTRLHVILESKVLWYTLSAKISDSSSLGLTVVDSAYDDNVSTVTNKYIKEQEIDSLIGAIRIFRDDDLSDFSSIDVSKVLGDGNLDIILDSIILEGTISSITYNLIKTDTSVPRMLVIGPNNENIVNWLTSRNPDGSFTDELGELKHLLNALSALGLDSDLNGDNFAFDINALLSLDEADIDTILASKVIHTTFSDKIVSMNLGSVSLVKAAIAFSDSFEYSDGKALITKEEFVNLISAVKCIAGEDGSLESMSFEMNSILSPQTKATILNSKILEATIIVKLQSSLSSAMKLPLIFSNPSVKNQLEQSTQSYEECSWIEYNELMNLLSGISALGLSTNAEDVSFSTNILKSLNEVTEGNKTKLEIATQSYILWATISDKLNSVSALCISVENYDENVNEAFREEDTNYILVSELENLIDAINLLVTGELGNSTEISTDVSNITENIDVLIQSFIVRTMISKTLLSYKSVMLEYDNIIVCMKTSDDYLVVSTEELVNLVDALNILGITSFNFEANATLVASIGRLTNDQIDNLLKSNIFWLAVSPVVKEIFGIFFIPYTSVSITNLVMYANDDIVSLSDTENVAKEDFKKIKSSSIS